MENWVTEPEFLKSFAQHYKTDEPIPNELVQKIINARYFNQGFATTEYVAASLLDMQYHMLDTVSNLDIDAFEKEYLQSIGLIPEIISRYRSTYFKHIWSGDYYAGYYSYIWAEVLDKDAFEAFREKGIFDRETAKAFRKNILEKGGSADPMELYLQFRGHEPDIGPLLRSRGLI
jgi:peptidyl-dipeptidase Dcp